MTSLLPVLMLWRERLTSFHAKRVNPLAPAPLVLSIALRLADMQRRTR